MKKTAFLFMMILVGFLSACQKDAIAPDELTELDQLTLSAARFAVEADPVTQTKCKGKLTEVATADLPAAVTAYISSTYAGATILFAGKDAEGKLVVAVKKADGTHVGVLFKADGTFAQELQRHGKKAKLTPVEVSALPGSIPGYIGTNYSGAEIKHAGTNADGNYFVHIVSGDTNRVLVFDADGAFVQAMDRPMHGKKKKKR
ncbi:hypothetical protein [Telluribacter sp.]|jgi:hypothetical protein|uniref:hypothetical protein n=1 Tax=Telluribacter sp. TaxID=1978767 RepID=UPI002E127D35|nr:hypothetical protein [Telluribacter sp.]